MNEEVPPIPKYPLGADKKVSIDPVERMREGYKSMAEKIGILSVAEGLLRQPGGVLYESKNGRFLKLIGYQLLLIVACLVVYGMTVGLFSLQVDKAQLWIAPTKIVLGMLFSGLICLPSLFIFVCLSGAEVTLKETVGLLFAMLSITALLLMGFGPVSFVFSQSTESVSFMGILQMSFWFIAMYYGFQFLHRAFQMLNGRTNGHLTMWTCIFVLVALQMTATLRPIIGTSDRFFQTEKKFFVTHWFETFDDEAESDY